MARSSPIPAALLLILMWPPATALAVGGLASPSSSGAPAAELNMRHQGLRVFMHRDPSSLRATLWLELHHSGEASQFGWLLPLPKAPKVSLGSAILFDLLDAQMAPRHLLGYVDTENCRDPQQGCAGPPRADTGADPGVDSLGARLDAVAAVVVPESGQKGPVGWQIIPAKSPAAVTQWLKANKLVLPAEAASVLADHVAAGDVFVAVKVNHSPGVHRLRPLILQMDDVPLRLPMRLTAATAAKDTSWVVTVAGEGRAVAKNMLNVRINPLRIDVLRQAANYDAALGGAMDEAAGRAFVTEFVGQPGIVQSIVSDAALDLLEVGQAKNLYGLALAVGRLDPLWWHAEVATLFETHLGLSKLLAGLKPASPAAALAALANCGRAWDAGKVSGCVASAGEISQAQAKAIGLAPKAVVAALEAEIVTPLRQARDLIDASAHVTRLAARISGNEMDRDPVFGFNNQLPTVDHVHIWPYWPVCPDGWMPAQRTRVEYPGLGSWIFAGALHGDLFSGITDARFAPGPWALAMEVLEESGSKVKVVHPADVIVASEAIKDASPGSISLDNEVPLRPPEPWQPPTSDPRISGAGDWPKPSGCYAKEGWRDGYPPPDITTEDGGCSAAGRGRPGPLAPAILLTALALWFRRVARPSPGLARPHG